MTNDLIKVDRVRSAGEAVAFEKLGADLLGVDLTPDPRFDDGREISVEQAVGIDQALERATLVPRLDLVDEPDRILRIAQALHARMVQSSRPTVPPAGVRAALSDAGIGIVYGGIEIAHDDDPGWVFSGYTDEQDLAVSFFQADVLPEYRDSWTFLRDRAPEYDDEFQIADLDSLATERPLVVGLDFTAENVREILGALPHVRGLVLTLADHARRGGVRFHSYLDTLDTLQALRG
ncbi:carbon-nitrogen hydrolase family protein [Paractinoplanes durhamensis]|uniref:Uncharacterized protein n=1 Tax=Paractinoplanes durhamensis TaxID=113563 RepID=A0ABQ3YY24_9ACTN|nr:hypothetical protein [Actinoplanes durhamensis]GIE02467.1 hypothetical protein Adu01nite_38170 [Actinoplanes durhamensis]